MWAAPADVSGNGQHHLNVGVGRAVNTALTLPKIIMENPMRSTLGCQVQSSLPRMTWRSFSRLRPAMAVRGIPAGQTSAHSP